GVRSGKAAGRDYPSRPLVSSIHTLPLALSKTRTVTGELVESPHSYGQMARSLFPGSVRYSWMSKRSAISFTRRAPDNITEELIAVLSSKASFEFKPLFEIILVNLRERNAANGGEELLRLRAYEKLQGLVSQGAVKRTVIGITKKYKGVATRMVA